MVGRLLLMLLVIYQQTGTVHAQDGCGGSYYGNGDNIEMNIPRTGNCAWVFVGLPDTSIFINITQMSGRIEIKDVVYGSLLTVGMNHNKDIFFISKSNIVVVSTIDYSGRFKMEWIAAKRCDLDKCQIKECEVSLFYSFGGACLVFVNIAVMICACYSCRGYKQKLERFKRLSMELKKAKQLSSSLSRNQRGSSASSMVEYEFHMGESDTQQVYTPLEERAEFTDIASLEEYRQSTLSAENIEDMDEEANQCEDATSVEERATFMQDIDSGKKPEIVVTPGESSSDLPLPRIDQVQGNIEDSPEESSATNVREDRPCSSSDGVSIRSGARQLQHKLLGTYGQIKSCIIKAANKISDQAEKSKRQLTSKSSIEESDDGYLKPMEKSTPSSRSLPDVQSLTQDVEDDLEDRFPRRIKIPDVFQSGSYSPASSTLNRNQGILKTDASPRVVSKRCRSVPRVSFSVWDEEN